jgi:hypothetical protein
VFPMLKSKSMPRSFEDHGNSPGKFPLVMAEFAPVRMARP